MLKYLFFEVTGDILAADQTSNRSHLLRSISRGTTRFLQTVRAYDAEGFELHSSSLREMSSVAGT
jgi:hypothetical protein